MNKEVEQGYIKEIENLKAKNRVLEQKIEARTFLKMLLLFLFHKQGNHLLL